MDEADPRVRRTRRAVAEAVNELLIERGWDAVTHAQVAARSGYARSTLYRHWPQRVDLLEDALRFEDARSHAPTLCGDVRDDLVAELEAFRLALFERHVGQLLSVLIERAEREPSIATIRRHMVGAGAHPLRRVLIRAVESGRLSAATPVDDAIAELAGPLIYMRLMTNERPCEGFIARLVDRYLTAAK